MFACVNIISNRLSHRDYATLADVKLTRFQVVYSKAKKRQGGPYGFSAEAMKVETEATCDALF